MSKRIKLGPKWIKVGLFVFKVVLCKVIVGLTGDKIDLGLNEVKVGQTGVKKDQTGL